MGAREMIVYKIVRKTHNLISYSWGTLEYIPGEYTEPYMNWGPLCAYNSLRAAVMGIIQDYGDIEKARRRICNYELWEATAIVSKENMAWDDTGEERYYSTYHDGLSAMKDIEGIVFCSHIRLDDKMDLQKIFNEIFVVKYFERLK